MQESLRQPVTHLVIDLVRGAQQQNVDDSRARAAEQPAKTRVVRR